MIQPLHDLNVLLDRVTDSTVGDNDELLGAIDRQRDARREDPVWTYVD